MKKKLLAGIAVLTIALTMALKVNLNAKNNNLSDISLANAEALAQAEIWEKVFDIYYYDPGNPWSNCSDPFVVPPCMGLYCVEGGNDWCF